MNRRKGFERVTTENRMVSRYTNFLVRNRQVAIIKYKARFSKSLYNRRFKRRNVDPMLRNSEMTLSFRRKKWFPVERR